MTTATATGWTAPTIADLKARNAELVGMVDTADLALEKLHIAHHEVLAANQALHAALAAVVAELEAEKVAHLGTLEALYYAEQTV